MFSACLFLIRLDHRHLWSPDELRVAGIAAEMAQTGDLIVPHLNGEPFLEEPPLYYWITSIIFRCFGETTLIAKLPAAIAAVLGTTLVYFLARNQKYSHLQSLAVSLVLVTSFEYFCMGRQSLPDMLLCLFSLGAMLSYYNYCSCDLRKHLWFVGFVVSLSCVILTNGLVGSLIVVCPLLFWLFVSPSIRRKGYFLLFAGIMLSLIPISVWMVYLSRRLGWNAVSEVLWVSNFERFAGSHHQRIEPFYYYLVFIPIHFLPWFLLLPYAIMHQVRKLQDPIDNNPALYNLIWLGISFPVLLVLVGTEDAYLLPLYPAAALLIGTSLGEILEKNLETDRWFELSSKVLSWVTILAPFTFGLICAHFKKPLEGIIISVPGIILGLWAFRKVRMKQWMVFYCIMVISLFWHFMISDTVVTPLLNPHKSFEALFNQCRVLEKEGADIVLYKPSEYIRGATTFYLQHRLPVIDQNEILKERLLSKNNLFVLARQKDTELLEYTIIHKSFNIDKTTYVVLARKNLASKHGVFKIEYLEHTIFLPMPILPVIVNTIHYFKNNPNYYLLKT